MKHVLFVDDDQNVLESLRDALRPWRREWRATFACGADAALERLASNRFDVVVSDMRMPGTDGAALLRRVQEVQPHAVRIVLSGSTEKDVLARASAVAHRFLGKPCDVHQLAEIVSATSDLGAASKSPLHQAVSGATALPCAPGLYADLTTLVDSPSAGVADVARLVERDIAITAKLLQLTNSAFVGLPRVVGRVEEAVSLLGLGIVKGVVLSAQALAAYQPRHPIPGFSIEALDRHATATAALTRRLVAAGPAQEEACVAAMLHDIGWVVLAAEHPDRLRELLAHARAKGRPLDVVERERGEPTHAELGAHLLALWGLPATVVAAVAHHHTPPLVSDPGVRSTVTAAVYLAAALVSEQAPGSFPGLQTTALDPDYLEALGVSGELDAWRALAAETAR